MSFPSLAVIQRTVVFSGVGVEVVLAVLAARMGWSPAWLVAWPLLLAVGYAAVLGGEFFAARRSFTADDPLRPSTGELVRAWWAECTIAPAIFLWSQPFRASRWPDRVSAGPDPKRGLVLVHGFFCNRGFWNRWQTRLALEGRPVIAVQLEPVFGPIERYADAIERAYSSMLEATGKPPVVVGHSMGGIALRAWLARRPEGAAMPHALVTIGSPHGGTLLAERARVANGRQMARSSAWLRKLARREAERPRPPTLCVWGACDNIVFPPRTAVLPGARVMHVPGTPHVRLAFVPAVYDAVIEWADRPELDATDRTNASATAGETLSNVATSA